MENKGYSKNKVYKSDKWNICTYVSGNMYIGALALKNAVMHEVN